MTTQNFAKTFKSINLKKLEKSAALWISALFIISMLSALSLYPVQAATTTTFGNTAVGTLTNYFDTAKDASRFQLAQNGQLQSITAYFTNTGFQAEAAIYTDNNGAPSTLITHSSDQQITKTGWQTFTVPQTSLSAGYYWLCVISSSASAKGTMTYASANTHAWRSATWSNEYKAAFGTPSGYEATATSIYATYTPTTTTTFGTQSVNLAPNPSVNLAPNPDGWSYATNGMWYAAGGVANDVLDKSVLYNGAPTIRQDPVRSADNYGREVNGPWLAVKPGDQIVFSCWIKTSASSYGDNNVYSGARIGIDFYGVGGSGVITGTASPDGSPVWSSSGGWASNSHLNYVHWGTSSWTQIVMSFTVASSYQAPPGYAGEKNNFYVGQWVTPSGIIPWMQVWSSTYGASDSGQAWFANPQLTINSP